MTSGATIPPNSGYMSTGTKLAFSSEEIDDGDNYDNSAYVYTCPAKGLYRIRAVVTLVLPAGNWLKMAVMYNSGGCAERLHIGAGTNPQSFEVDAIMQADAGDTFWISAVNNTGGAIAVSAGTLNHIYANTFEVVQM